jgi:hypothetical protein
MSRNNPHHRNTDEEIQDREKQLKREKERNQQLHNDRVALLKLPEFQRVMADIIAKGGMFRSVMTGNSQTYHLSGRQDFTREIWADMASANQELAFELLKPKFKENFDD